MRICDAKFGTLSRFDGNALRMAAHVQHATGICRIPRRRGPYIPETGSTVRWVMRTKQVSHTADIAASPAFMPIARLGGRTILRLRTDAPGRRC